MCSCVYASVMLDRSFLSPSINKLKKNALYFVSLTVERAKPKNSLLDQFQLASGERARGLALISNPPDFDLISVSTA